MVNFQKKIEEHSLMLDYENEQQKAVLRVVGQMKNSEDLLLIHFRMKIEDHSLMLN